LPAKLLECLNFYYDETPATDTIMPVENAAPNTTPHWPGGNFGQAISKVNSVVIHETTGRPTYAYINTMKEAYTNPRGDGVGPQLYVSGSGAVYRFMDIDPPRITGHAGYMNGVSVGIENGDLGDNPDLGPNAVSGGNPDNSERARWRTLNSDATVTEDLTGMKAYMLLHPSNSEEGVLIWLGTRNYTGSQNASQAATTRFDRMIFTEANYRSLVLLCRYLAELFQIPRNFPVLPYVTMDQQSGTSTAASTVGPQVTRFRQFILCDERSDDLATASGSSSQLISANDASLQTWYPQQNVRLSVVLPNGKTVNFDHNTAWTKMMSNASQGYRGFAGHGFVGDVAARDSHSMCPGPFFDWHRLAREVWDWWWYCFDFAQDPPPLTTVKVSTNQRAYRRAGGSTPLREYFFDADGAASDYTSARTTNDSTQSGANVFSLANTAPVFAMTNGVIVAARLSHPAAGSTAASNGFILIRHEVFHLTTAGKIDFDSDPTYVYSLTYYIDQPGVVFANISDHNPDWYNRFLVRLTETELAVKFTEDHPTDAALNRAWVRRMDGGHGQRSMFGSQLVVDAQAYRPIADALGRGDVAYFPTEESRTGATPVRAILGDFLGVPGNLPPTLATSAHTGVLVDIFTANPLPQKFTLTPNLPATRQGRVLASAEPWWADMCGYVDLENDPAKALPVTDPVWHYDMVDFLTWINGITWASEWKKYGLVDLLHPDGPPRPKTRKTVF